LERQGHDVNLGLTGRVVVVTGDSSGIGLATVESLVEEGAQVATSTRALEQGCNVRDRTACQEFVTAVVDRFGHLDALPKPRSRTADGSCETFPSGPGVTAFCRHGGCACGRIAG
jgi:hypothetical protein